MSNLLADRFIELMVINGLTFCVREYIFTYMTYIRS